MSKGEAIKVQVSKDGIYVANAVNFPMIITQANSKEEMDNNIRDCFTLVRDMINDILDNKTTIDYYEVDNLFRDLNTKVDKQIKI